MTKRLGILTGGGDCPGLNSVIRAVVKDAVLHRGYEVVGIEDGFQGLYEQRYRALGMADVRGLLSRGGTILGSSNRCNPFRYPLRRPGGGEDMHDVSAQIMANLKALDLEALIVVGGDGTMAMSQGLAELGARVVGVPKTIDNDLPCTDLTFGHMTAVDIATEAVERLHSTAESHDRVMLCEVMGRTAGWIALASGIAGGADAILIPEIPYRVERVAEAVKRRAANGVTFSIVVVAEGARPEGGQMSTVEGARAGQLTRLGGAAERVATALAALVDTETRVTVLGHVQRGGPPNAFDRLLATRFGTAAVDLVARGALGQMVCLHGDRVESVSMSAATGALKLVDPAGELVRTARATGVEMGAE